MSVQNLPSVYDPGSVEGQWYEHWKENNYFAPGDDHSKKPFSSACPRCNEPVTLGGGITMEKGFLLWSSPGAK